MLVDHKSIKNTVKSSVYFYAFGICTRKSCTWNVDEIGPKCEFSVDVVLSATLADRACFRELNLINISEMIIFMSLLSTFEAN